MKFSLLAWFCDFLQWLCTYAYDKWFWELSEKSGAGMKKEGTKIDVKRSKDGST